MHRRLRVRRDRVLWNSAMRAIMPDATAECEQLATEAAFHHAPMVRMQACAYFSQHPNPLKADILLQLMNDEYDRNVRLAAIRAAGFSRSPQLITGRIAPSLETGNRGSRNQPPPAAERSRDQSDLAPTSLLH